MLSLWIPLNNLQESGLSFYHVGPRNWTWINRLGERYHCPMNHLTGPSFLCLSFKKNLQWMFCLYKFNWTLLLLCVDSVVWTILWCCSPWFLRLGLSPRPGPHILGYTGWSLLSASPILGLQHTTVSGCGYFYGDYGNQIQVLMFVHQTFYQQKHPHNPHHS